MIILHLKIFGIIIILINIIKLHILIDRLKYYSSYVGV